MRAFLAKRSDRAGLRRSKVHGRVLIRNVGQPERKGSTANAGSGRLIAAATGVVALLVGVLIYTTARDLTHSILIPNSWRLSPVHWFGTAAEWLPSALHSFAFSLLTAVSLWPCRRAVLLICCAVWASIDILFEFGQRADLKGPLIEAIARIGGDNLLARLLSQYFALGVFDPHDVAAAGAGAIAAAALLLFTSTHINARGGHV